MSSHAWSYLWSRHYLENRSWLSDELWITVLGFLCFKGKHRSNTSETASNYPFNVLRLTSLFVWSNGLLLYNMWLQELCFIQSLSYMFLYEFKVFRNQFILKSTTFLLAFSWNLMDIYLYCVLFIFICFSFIF